LPDSGSLEYDVFQAKKLLLRTYKHTGLWHPLNSPKQIAEFEEGWKPLPGENLDLNGKKTSTQKTILAEGTYPD